MVGEVLVAPVVRAVWPTGAGHEQGRALALRSTRALIVVSLFIAFLVPLVPMDHTRIAGMALLPLALTFT